MHDPDSNLARFQTHGMRWVAESTFESTLREVIIPHLGALESAGATAIKHTMTRSIYRLEHEGQAVFIKHHKVRSLGERLKYVLLPSRASVEWDVSRAVAERGFPVTRAVAFGERRVAGVLTEAVLVSEAVEDAAPLSNLLRERRELLGKAAHLIRRMHDANVLHRDLHAGNILVRDSELTLIDLHRVALGRAVSERKRVASVAQFLAAIGPLLSEGNQLLFVREYLGPDATQQEIDRFTGTVERAAAGLRERRYASRTKRCVKRSTGFRRSRVRGMVVYRRADFAAELVKKAVEQHNQGGSGVKVLKSDRRARVSVVELADERRPRRLCVKEFYRPRPPQRLGDLFRGSRARLAWLGSSACRVRGIPTPKPLAMAEAGPRSFLITEYIDNARQLNDYTADHGRPCGKEATRRWHRFIREAADFVRLIHDHRLRHLDLSAKNILVRERGDGWEFYLLDVSDIRLWRAPSLRFKIKNLGQLDQSYVKPSRTDRLRFYRHYSRGRPELGRPEFLAEIDAISRARHEHWLHAGGGEKILEERKQQGKPV